MICKVGELVRLCTFEPDLTIAIASALVSRTPMARFEELELT